MNLGGITNPIFTANEAVKSIPDDAGVVFPPLLALRAGARALTGAPIAAPTLGGIAGGFLETAAKAPRAVLEDPEAALGMVNPTIVGSLIGEKQWREAARRGLPEAQQAMKDWMRATKLLKDGKHPLEIEQATRWIRKGGHWVKEVPDNESRLLKPFPKVGEEPKDMGVISDYYTNPRVERIVPSTRNIEVVPMEDPSTAAMYLHETPEQPHGAISINPDAPTPPFRNVTHGTKPYVIHEVNHRLQEMGGRADPSGTLGKGLEGAEYSLHPDELESEVVAQRRQFNDKSLQELPYLEHEEIYRQRLQKILREKGGRGILDPKDVEITALRAAAAKRASGALRWDPTGKGGTPDHLDINYFGFQRPMTPAEFLKTARRLTPKERRQNSLDFFRSADKTGTPVAPPQLYVEWDAANKRWLARGHEGRHRSTVANETDPNTLVNVHIIPRGGIKARDLTDEMRNAPIISEDEIRHAEFMEYVRAHPLTEEDILAGRKHTFDP